MTTNGWARQNSVIKMTPPPPRPTFVLHFIAYISSFVAVIHVIIPLHSRDKFLEPESREGSY